MFTNTKEVPETSTIEQASSRQDVDSDNDDDERSMWFDHFLAEFEAVNSLELWPFSLHTCEYSSILAFPDNINEDWARAILLCCDWVESINKKTFISYHKANSCRSWFSCGEEMQKKIEEENPTLDKWQVKAKMADDIEAKVMEQLPKDWKKVRKYAKVARERLAKLHPTATAHVMPTFERSTDKPDFYVEPEDRECISHYTPSWENDPLPAMRKYPDEEEKEKEAQLMKLTEELLAEILTEEQTKGD